MIKPKNEYDSSFSILYDILLQQNSLMEEMNVFAAKINDGDLVQTIEIEKPVITEVVKEVVVEKPIIVEKPVVVETQVVVEKPVPFEVTKEVVKIIYKCSEEENGSSTNTNGQSQNSNTCNCGQSQNSNINYHCNCQPKQQQVKISGTVSVKKNNIKQPVLHTIVPSHDFMHDIHCCATPQKKKCYIIGVK